MAGTRRPPGLAERDAFVLGFICGLTLGVTVTAIVWAAFD